MFASITDSTSVVEALTASRTEPGQPARQLALGA
jgi:hypothetical protein